MSSTNKLLHVPIWVLTTFLFFNAFGQRFRIIETPNGLQYSVTYNYIMLLVICLDVGVKCIMFYLLLGRHNGKEFKISSSNLLIIISPIIINPISWMLYKEIFNDETNDMVLDYYIPYSLVFHFLIVFIAYGYSSVKYKRTLEIEKKDLRKLQVETELQLLKSQINPHFLFNTLNNIYSLAVKENISLVAQSLSKLANMMRYMTYEPSHGRLVTLSQEIKYLEDYVDLERLRLVKQNLITFNTSVENPNLKIAPMIFIALVENAFKHGLMADGINIELKESKGVVSLKVTNSIRQTKENSKGIGIRNIEKRLQILYPEKHSLLLKKEKGRFYSHLHLNMI